MYSSRSSLVKLFQRITTVPVESTVVISFYLRLLNRSNKFDNNAPSDEALRVMICIASPMSSRNTFSISTSLSPSFHSLRYSYRENCSEGDIHLALPAPQRHGFNGIIAYWGGNVNGLCKKREKKQSRNSAFSLLCIQPVFKRYYCLTEHRLSQCYQRRVTLADTHSPSYLLRYHYPSEIVYSSYYSGSFHI